MSAAACAARFWQRYDIRQIEDLQNAVLGAELEAIQLAGPRIEGSLAFGARDGIIYSSALINGRAALRGTLSRDAVTIGIGLRFTPGSRYWLNAVTDGDISVSLPGGVHDAIYASGSLFAAASLTEQRLEEEAVKEGIPLSRALLARTGLHKTPIPARDLIWLRSRFTQIHAAQGLEGRERVELNETLVRVALAHFRRFPESGDGRIDPQGRARTVRRALEYIRENLTRPISMDALVRVTETPRRTLYRVFLEVLNDTPLGFIRRLRLHRIRQELISGLGSGCGISEVARGWGMGADLGRMAGRYQSLFGEFPSMTITARDERLKTGSWF